MFQPGDRVSVVTRRRRSSNDGTVVGSGPCGFGRCPWGDQCVNVLVDGMGLSENFSASALSPVES